jgi:hypothetical protein
MRKLDKPRSRGRAIDNWFIVNPFLRKQTLLIKDEKQHKTWNHDQCCENDYG